MDCTAKLGLVPLPGQHHHRIRQRYGLCLQRVEKLEPIHVREIEVQYQAIRLGGSTQVQPFFACRSLDKV